MAKKTQLTITDLLTRIGITNVLDVEDVALLLKLSESRVRHMCKDREIPHYKGANGNITFLKSEIEAWRLGQRVPTSTEIKQQAVTYTALNPA